ncbi:queuosine-tRNA galactosyltransferase isoform X9 [Equus asinus]|uniref:queuosine-tRNA galactosyltransferase isoform X9 n=1 Tax=Equus asinus TaxID=9793 RepID=UPI0038F66F38
MEKEPIPKGYILCDPLTQHSFFFFKDFIFFPFSPQSTPVHSCVFFVVGPSSCGMWDTASAWFDEQCHVCAQDSNQRNTGLPAAERTNLTTWPRGQPLHNILEKTKLQHWENRRVVATKGIIGCQVRREPPNSTERYTRWINQLASDQLLTQVFTSHGPTVVMPTWFCSRAWFSHVGPFDEGGQGVPEDLLFFYSHLRKGGGVVRVDQSLLIYRYHPKAATHSVLETTIWTHRVRFLEERALPHWAAFTIWNAGRQGRRLYRSLTAESRRKVVAFCDVDENKIKKGFYSYEDSEERPKPRVPILHFRAARPPFVICVKLAARFVVAGYTQQITDMDPRWQNSEENKPHRHPCRSLTLS